MEPSIEAATVSYEENFDPPAKTKLPGKARGDCDLPNSNSNVSANRGSSTAAPRSYDDALLLASLSDEQPDKEEERAVDADDNADDAAQGQAPVDARANSDTDTARTPRRSNVHGDAAVGLALDDANKKVTPDRTGDGREWHRHAPRAAYPAAGYGYDYDYPPYNPYPPPASYKYSQQPYYHHANSALHCNPYYHHKPPHPTNVNANSSSSNSNNQTSKEPSQSHSPLPYHPLSRRYETAPVGSAPETADWYAHASHTTSYNFDYDQRTQPQRTCYTYPYYPRNVHATGQPIIAPTNSQADSKSPTRQPYTVSMDENSPRIKSHTADYNNANAHRHPDYPSAPITTPHPATPARSTAYDYLPPAAVATPHPYPPYYPAYEQHPSHSYARDHYSTPPPPPPPVSYDMSWDNSNSASNPNNSQIIPNNTRGNDKNHQFRKGARGTHSEPVILRKKFSWRNYPEVRSYIVFICNSLEIPIPTTKNTLYKKKKQLEEYLIANRNEYLHHSSLNYTAEQKHFNNRLTEGLLELAAKHNYIFDEGCFNFVAVRDRIRCYYKSYVQSSKKRGVIVGFPKVNRKDAA
jgi:hypothetical protein